MATSSYYSKYILKDTPENRKLFKKLNKLPKLNKKIIVEAYKPATDEEKEEFKKKLLKRYEIN